MSDEPRPKTEKAPAEKPASEEILDKMLDDLAAFFPGEMRERAREFILDAAAAHPVTRVLVERVDNRAAPERSGEEPTPARCRARAVGKSGGREEVSAARPDLAKVQARELARSTVVSRLTARMAPKGAPLKAEDLFSIGHEREVRAAGSFDPERGVPFEAYTYPLVHQEMVRAIGHARGISEREQSGHFDATYEFLGRAEETGNVLMDSDEQSRAHLADHYAGMLGTMLATTISSASLAPSEDELIDNHDRPRLRAKVAEVLDAQGEAGTVIRLRYLESLTWNDIAAQVGMSARTAQRVHDEAWPRLCRLLEGMRP
jgi:RNA polymerase sigma factor (sigma-70 family)